jgi:hypothetical protein
MNPNKKIPKNPQKFICDICQYKTGNKKDFNKHLLTLKHEILTNPNKKIPKNPQTIFTCECNKTYKHLSSLCCHKKKCTYIENTVNDNDNVNDDYTDNNNDYNNNDYNNHYNNNINIISTNHENNIQKLTNLVIEVVKNNNEFQKQMFDMCKNIQSNVITNCNNTNNNTFNLQVFLNEYCKDAMNITEFVDSFNLEVSDLENVGRVVYIEGMSNIIINKIKELDVNKRPIHCSDIKREIFYIKDDDKWEREDEHNTKFRKVIKRVSGKNIGMLNAWKEIHPECLDSDSVYNDIYMKLIISAMGANDIEGNETKIMKKVAKHVVIDKKIVINN